MPPSSSSAAEPVGFPSISLLLSLLFYLGYYLVKCYVFGKSCDMVEGVQSLISAWFTLLKEHIKDKAQALINAAAVAVWWWIGWLDDLIDDVDAVVDGIITWASDTVAPVVTWVKTYKDNLAYFVTWIYGWVKAFWSNPLGTVEGWLGWLWTYTKIVMADFSGWVKWVLGSAWTWLAGFWSDPLGTLRGLLGAAWDWLMTASLDFLRYLDSLTGGAVLWLVKFFQKQWDTIYSIIGPPLDLLAALFALGPKALIDFIQEVKSYWYDVLRGKRSALTDFLENPAVYVLAALWDHFLDWFEDLIAENW